MRRGGTAAAASVVGAVVLVVVVVVLLALDGSTSSRRVSVIGDSITFSAGRDIAAAIQGEYHPDVHGEIGRRIDEMLPQLRAAVDKRPFAVVVNLGTNDALQATSHPDWRTGFTRMVETLSGTRCAIVTTISTIFGDQSSRSVATGINAAIVTAVGNHSNLHVIDWDAAVHRADGATLLTDDRVHPSAAGQLTLANLIRTTVDRDCRGA